MKIFGTFECSGQILSNSLCQFWNDNSIPLQILYPSSVSWKIIPLYFFSSNNIYFAPKEHIKMKIFETFKCSGQNSSNSSCQFWNDKSIPLQILHHSSVPSNITLLCLYACLAQTLYILVKSSPLRYKSLRLSSSRIKIRQIPFVNFARTSHFLFIFFIILQCHYT